MMKQIMKRAHEIAKELEGDYMARMSIALRMAWAEFRTETEKTEMGWKVETLIKMGASRWQKYGKDRVYLSSCGAQIINLSVERYNSGNICYAEINGEKISNADAQRYMAAFESAYIDMTSGKLCGTHGRYEDLFAESMNAYRA